MRIVGQSSWRIFSISISNLSGISFQQHIWKWNKASSLLLQVQVQVQWLQQWLNLHLFAFLLRVRVVRVRVVRVRVRVRVPPCPRHMYMAPQKRRGTGDVSPLHIPALSPTAYASHMDALTTLSRDHEHGGTHFGTIHTCTRGAPPAVPKLREVGSLASWAVTSAKTGNGVDLLRDNNLDTYWQSDGSQPHLIDVTFPHKLALGEVHIYTDYKHDESYTPSRVVVRAGTDANNLREIRVVDLYEPSGWVVIPLKAVAVEAPQQQQEQPSAAAAAAPTTTTAPAQGDAPTSAGATTTTTTSTTTTTEATAMSMDTTDNDISAPRTERPT
ncbi:anaphase-promoting complex subunit 10 [Pycnococcus provasolii]